MSRRRYEPDEDEDEDDWRDDDYDPDDPETYPAGLYDDDGLATVPCPHCQAEILEDSEQCPRCGKFISKEDSPSAGFTTIGWVLIILMLFAAAMWAVGRG